MYRRGYCLGWRLSLILNSLKLALLGSLSNDNDDAGDDAS